MHPRAALLLGLLAPLIGAVGAAGQENDTVRVYIGTYTKADSEGINLLEMDPDSGELTLKGVVAETKNPSFLAIHPTRPLLFAVNEISDYEDESSGSVSAFEIDPDSGALTLLNHRSSKGGAPCHIVIDPEGKHVLVANYSGGNVTVLPIEEDGSLGEASDVRQHVGSGPNPNRQQEPHAHSINLDASGTFAVAADLGIDQYLVYKYDPEAGSLSVNTPAGTSVAPGAGPRHFDFHPNGTLAFGINEIASTVTAFQYDPEAGTLEELQTLSSLPGGFDGNNSTADIHVHPSGKFLYGSNRGHHSIAIFQIDEQAGTLEPVGHAKTGGETPRNFCIDPSGKFLLAANQGTDSITVFKIDPETGELEKLDFEVEVPAPVCIKFAPTGE